MARPPAPRAARRAARIVEPGPSVYVTPASTDPAVAHDWFSTFEGAGLDGVVAKRLDDAYQPNKRVLVKVKHQRTADCVLAGYRIHKDGEGVGSMLLGLFDDDGDLHHVGVAAAFTASQRKALLDELTPLTENAIDGHPWADWAEFATAEAPQPAPPGGDESLERRQGPLVGADPGRAGRRGDVRPARERAVPPRRVVRALASRPRAGELPLRPARRRVGPFDELMASPQG